VAEWQHGAPVQIGRTPWPVPWADALFQLFDDLVGDGLIKVFAHFGLHHATMVPMRCAWAA
jgi:hypothetical protein